MTDYTRVYRLKTNNNNNNVGDFKWTALLFFALTYVFSGAVVVEPKQQHGGSPNGVLLDAMLRQQQVQQPPARWSTPEENDASRIYYQPVVDTDDLSANNIVPVIGNQLGGLNFDNGVDPSAIQFDEILNDATNTGDEESEDSSFFELSPKIGQTAGLAMDKNDNLVLFHRSSRVWNEFSFDENNKLNASLGVIPNSTIAVLESQTGKLLAEHGAMQFYMPHGLTIDADSNYWLTDVGSHQVIKLDKNFKTVMELGEKLIPGNDEKHFCKPTDVAVAKNGDFFVADGYCNSRIMKFNKDGKFLTSFGGPNSQNPPQVGEFFVPHSLALIEDLNLLCVADRENKRIQCFAAGLTEGSHYHPRAFVPTGTFFTKAESIGRVYAIREKHHYLVGVTNNDESGQVEPQVFVMDMNTGRANTFAKGLENAHALALSDQGDIFISQINPNQIVKFSVPEQI